jgi:hypothetical protein
MQVVDIFDSYSTIALPEHLGIASRLPFSRPRELQSLVQPVGVHRIPPSTFPSAPSTETATVEVVSEQVVQPSAPSASESPSRPEIFTVR